MLGLVISIIHQGGLAGYIMEVATAGINAAQWMGKLF
jgi:hypothetical protein